MLLAWQVAGSLCPFQEGQALAVVVGTVALAAPTHLHKKKGTPHTHSLMQCSAMQWVWMCGAATHVHSHHDCYADMHAAINSF